MLDLVLDVKIYIACFDQEVWVMMTLYDDEFCNYAYKKEGYTMFVHYFYKDNTLFGKYHSIFD